MRDWALDEYHDLAVTDDFGTVEGLDEMIQACRIALLTIQGEVYLDGNEGMPWNHGMFWVWMTQEEKILHTRRVLLGVEGVQSIHGINYAPDIENKSAQIRVNRIETVEGLITGIGV